MMKRYVNESSVAKGMRPGETPDRRGVLSGMTDSGLNKTSIPFALATLCLLTLTACVESVRNAIPFLPPPKYVEVTGGRKLKRTEISMLEREKALLAAIRVNPKDAVAYTGLGDLYQKIGWYRRAKDRYRDAIEHDPTLSQPHYSLGLLCIYEDRFSEAFDELKKAQALSPDDARIQHRLGQAAAGQGEIDQALKAYDGAIALDVEYTPAYLEKAKLLYSLRRYAEATALCRSALTHVPKVEISSVAKESRGNSLLDKFLPSGQDEEPPKTFRAEAAYDLALCLKAQGQFREALSVLLQAENIEPARADVQILKARLLEASGDAVGALAILQPLRQTFPNMAEIPKRMAKLYQKSGQTELASKIRLEAAELDHSDRELQEEAAHNAEQSHDVARAIAIYERLVRVDPEELRYRRTLAKAYDTAGIQREAIFSYQEIINRSPEDFATRRRQGMLCADVPGFEGRAMLRFKEVLNHDPKDAEVHRKLGELLLKSAEIYRKLNRPGMEAMAVKNFSDAENHIRETLLYAPKDAQAHHNLATLLYGQKRFEEAVKEYNAALSIDPNFALAQLNLAKVLLGLNRDEEAAGLLRKYLAQQPLDEEARRGLANTLRQLGRREEAIQEYEAIAALKPGDTEASMKLAELQTGLGRPRSSVGIYEAILEKHPADIDALREAGRLYGDLHQPLRAIYCWQRLLNLKTGDLEAQSQLATAYKAIGADEAALQRYETVGKSGTPEAWKNAAALHLKRNENERAAQAFREAIKIEGQKPDIEARMALASLLQTSGKPSEKDEATKLYREILLLEPPESKNVSCRLNLANLLSDSNHLPEAQDEYEAILRDQPSQTGALVGLGVIWRKRGKYDKALENYHFALKADPNLRVAHFNMALIYDYYLNDKPKAQIHYDRFVELGGDPAKLPEELQPDPRRKPEVP